ncbi:MAG: hypothetical protein ACLS70_10160 [[Clostridium] symbiosum]
MQLAGMNFKTGSNTGRFLRPSYLPAFQAPAPHRRKSQQNEAPSPPSRCCGQLPLRPSLSLRQLKYR